MTGDPPPFARETGLFVCADEDGGELRIHLREGGRWHWHRWRFAVVNFEDEPRWVGPVAFGVTATEIYDAAEALRREADAKRVPTKGAKRG